MEKVKSQNAKGKSTSQKLKLFTFNLYFLLLTFVLLLLLSGCAKVVTPIFPAGKYITIDINYRGNIDTALNKYYIVFNFNAASQIPFMPIQFIEPGETPSQPDIDYYGQYYSTWNSYVVLDGNAFSLVKGPFTSEALPSKEVIATWSGAESKKIQLTLDLSKIGTPERLNFDFITVDKDEKLVRDNLSDLNSSPSPYYIFTISDTVVSGSDETTTVSRESLDILDWRVLVQ